MRIAMIGIVTAMLLAVVAARPGVAADDIWKVPVTVGDSSMSNVVYLGGAIRSTDGYDPLEDAEAYFSGNLTTYISHPDWGRSGSFMNDIRSLNLPQTWSITVEERTVNTNVTVQWDLSEPNAYGRCNGNISFTLTDGSTGISVDMGSTTTYQYYSTSAAPRVLTVTAARIGSVTPKLSAPAELNVNPGEGVVNLKWSPVVGAVGYRIYRESNGIGVLVSGDTLVTQKVGSDTVTYLDKTLSRGKKNVAVDYTYSIVPVDANGCTGSYKTVSATR